MEPVTAERWLYATLTADPAIGEVYKGDAPGTAADVFVNFTLYAAGDVKVVNGKRVFSALSYTVKVSGPIEPGSLTPSNLVTIAQKIDQLLHRKTGAAEGGEVLSCVRDFPVDYTEIDEGTVYQHLGGVYQLSVQNQ